MLAKNAKRIFMDFTFCVLLSFGKKEKKNVTVTDGIARKDEEQDWEKDLQYLRRQKNICSIWKPFG